MTIRSTSSGIVGSISWTPFGACATRHQVVQGNCRIFDRTQPYQHVAHDQPDRVDIGPLIRRLPLGLLGNM